LIGEIEKGGKGAKEEIYLCSGSASLGWSGGEAFKKKEKPSVRVDKEGGTL